MLLSWTLQAGESEFGDESVHRTVYQVVAGEALEDEIEIATIEWKSLKYWVVWASQYNQCDFTIGMFYDI